MIVLTCISDFDHPGYNLLSSSCNYYGLRLKTLFHKSSWSSHRLKDNYVKRYLETLNPNEVILFTDGYDTMFASDEQEILNKYYSLDVPVVFSSEANCFPEESFKTEYGAGKTKFQYLNSGGYIGRVSKLLNLLDEFEFIKSTEILLEKDSYNWSNQFLWTKLYLLNRDKIALDYDCSIFQTFVNRIDIFNKDAQDRARLFLEEANNVLDDFYIEGGRLYNKLTNTKPSHLHFNGYLFKNIVNSGLLDEILPWVKSSS